MLICIHKKKYYYPLKVIIYRIFNTHCPDKPPINFSAPLSQPSPFLPILKVFLAVFLL